MTTAMPRSRLVPWTLLLALLGGCAAVGPDYQKPEVPVPATWRVDSTGAQEAANTAWWAGFKDPELDALIRTALAENKDLLIAAQRVEEFSGRYAVYRAATLPQLSQTSGSARERLSQDRHIPLPDRVSTADNVIEVGFAASWEIDLWGKIRRNNEAARAQLLSVEEAQRAMVLTVVADVAASYVQLLEHDRELEILQQTLKNRADWLQLLEKKFTGGGISRLPVVQARAAYQETAAAIPSKQREIALLEDALSVLLGRNPGAIKRGSSLKTLVPPQVPAGIPSTVLAQRPDVLAAEQELVAANARIGVAKAQYYPTISLTGKAGYASDDLFHIVRHSSHFASIGGDLLLPLFDAGRIAGEVKSAEAVQREALLRYLKASQNALREVEDALVTHQKARERLSLEDEKLKTEQEYATLARKRYEGGYTSYIEVLDAERALYAAEVSQAQSQRDVHTALVGLYKALGGGWLDDTQITHQVRRSAEADRSTFLDAGRTPQ